MREYIVHFLIGFAIVGVGVFFVLRTTTILDFFGPIEWAERRLGSSSMFYKLLGIVLAFVGLIIAFDLWNAFLGATIGQIFPGTKSR